MWSWLRLARHQQHVLQVMSFMEFLPVPLRITWVSPRQGFPVFRSSTQHKEVPMESIKGPVHEWPLLSPFSFLYLSLLFPSLHLPSFLLPSSLSFPHFLPSPFFFSSIDLDLSFYLYSFYTIKTNKSRNAFQLPDTRGTQMDGSGYPPAVEQLGGEIDKWIAKLGRKVQGRREHGGGVMIISRYYWWVGVWQRGSDTLRWALAEGQELPCGWGRGPPIGKEQHVLKLGGRKTLVVQGVWISRGMYLERSNWSWMPADKDPTALSREGGNSFHLLNKCSAQVQIPGQEEFGGGHPLFHFPVGGASELYMARRQKLGSGCLSSPLGPALLFLSCSLGLSAVVGKGGKGNCRKDSILATHSAAEIRWAYLHWLFR